MTRKFIPTWIAAATLALGAATAHAQTPATGQQAAQPVQAASADAHGHKPHARHHGKRMDPAQRAELRAKRVAEFKQKLNLTAAQQGAWDRYQAALKPPARPDRDAMKAERQALATMTTPQRIDAMQKRHADMSARMQARGEATKAFYAQLNPEQQKVFDTETARRFGHGGHGPRGHGKHGHDGAKRPAAPAAPAK